MIFLQILGFSKNYYPNSSKNTGLDPSESQAYLQHEGVNEQYTKKDKYAIYPNIGHYGKNKGTTKIEHQWSP